MNEESLEDAVIFVMDSPDEPYFLDSEGNRSDPDDPESFTTLVAGNGRGKVRWFAGAGVSKITEIKIVSGGEFISNLRDNDRDGRYWKANVDLSQAGADAKYDITFVTYKGEIKTIDPKIEVEGPTG